MGHQALSTRELIFPLSGHQPGKSESGRSKTTVGMKILFLEIFESLMGVGSDKDHPTQVCAITLLFCSELKHVMLGCTNEVKARRARRDLCMIRSQLFPTYGCGASVTSQEIGFLRHHYFLPEKG